MKTHCKEQTLLEIARKHLLHDPKGTLESRKRDCLDFHEVGVWGIKAALLEAYEAGRSVGKDEMKVAE